MARGGPKPSLKTAFVAFQHQAFRYLFVSGAASFMGMQMMIIARGGLAWDLTESFAATGLLSLSFGLPMLLFSLFGGATADRVEKRRLVMVLQLLNGSVALVTAAFIYADVINIPILFILGLGQGTMFAFMGPARMALLTEVVPREQYMNAIALNTASISASTILGPALAGGLIFVGGFGAAYLMMGVMGIFSFIMISRLPAGTSHVLAEGQVRQGMLSEVKEGVSYAVNSPILRTLMLMAIVPAVFGMPYQVLLPGFASDDLNAEWVFPAMLTIAGVGALVGSILIASLNDYERKPFLQWVIGLGMASSLVLLGIAGKVFGIAGVLPVAVFLGLTIMGYQTLNNTLLMSATDPRFTGRVMSIMMLSMSSIPIVSLPLGALADVAGATNMFIAMGSMIGLSLAIIGSTKRDYVFGETPVASHAPAVGAGAEDLGTTGEPVRVGSDGG